MKLEAGIMLIQYVSLREIEVGLVQGIIITCKCIDENNPSLTEVEAGLILGILLIVIVITAVLYIAPSR